MFAVCLQRSNIPVSSSIFKSGYNATKEKEVITYSNLHTQRGAADFQYPDEKMWLESVFEPIDQGNR